MPAGPTRRAARRAAVLLGLLAALLAVACTPAPTPPPDPPGETLLTWSGIVDGVDWLEFQADRCTIVPIKDRPIERPRLQVHRPLTPDVFPVELVDRRGRGDIRLISQGGPWNGHTLVVEIDDSAFGGAAPYSFRVRRANPTPRPRVALHLQAKVDDEVRVTVAGCWLEFETLSGHDPTDVRYAFEGEGVRPDRTYRLRLIRGRGEVSLQPAEAGGAVVLLIHDPARGATEYQLEVIEAADD